MLTRSLVSAMAGAALICGMGFSDPASASFSSCTGTGYDISDNVDPSSGCTILNPLDGAVNDDVSPPASSYTVNVEQFFGFDDWSFDGKWDSVTGGFVDSSGLFNFTGDGQSGTFTAVGDLTDLEIMFVFKDGGDTNLVGYLIDVTALLARADDTGTYSSPFEEPPFTFPGTGSRDISHISVYYREGGGPPPQELPEPTALALFGIGLAGLWAIRRRQMN